MIGGVFESIGAIMPSDSRCLKGVSGFVDTMLETGLHAMVDCLLPVYTMDLYG